MVQKTAITEVIKSLAEVESRFNLRRTEDEQFFTEWYENLPEITDEEKASLDIIRRRYLYHLADGNLTEGTVTLLIGSPLLEKAGFYDYPFKIRGEASVELVFDEDDDEVETLRGRIDALVLQNQFWVALLESKRTTISVMSALPQTLAYMMANPQPDKPVFGMITNGDAVVFVKLSPQGTPQYDVSGTFSPAPLRNQLYNVLQILKRIGQIIT
ncbi:type I restriction endonuclease subunit R [Iningainema tapete]|uniref:Type I restriction endonuclease subunit R n=1 Tax=Iningainema tapete BLCC-T55 TaxID=2748662 RepID=A0A8J6XLH9_9CYAN|nr:type I restriction endonuclease subunit R [Iningainema tapete]MBD2775272.1 type I restriction endonuclease subunit R [Iningainema tapete BLCC-T55]